MLQTLRLQNYRCFSDHSVSFNTNTVIVGKNNAGKSTIVEALHIIASIVNRKGARFAPPPSDLEIPRFHQGISPKISHLSLNLKTAFHRYGDPPARLTATFTGGITIHAYIHAEGVYATVTGPKGWVTTGSAFTALGLPNLHILPQVAPIQAEESPLREDYINENLYTRLAARHFRNQIYRNQESFTEFKTLAESTWHGLRIDSIHDDGTNLTLLVTDGDFVAEVAWMGHGLQMWLQTMWFVAKTPNHATIVLDEPDVYMHPDLQRRLYRLIKQRFAQAIIATHSVEIMAEADPGDILIINNKQQRSYYANTEPGVQVLVDQLGGIHNVHLARLWNAKKVLLVEGKDLEFLRAMHRLIFPEAETPIDAIPNLSIGGWGGWPQAIGSARALKNAVGDKISTYCILDRDYHTAKERGERHEQAANHGINLHIWGVKEIENHLLNPVVISRLIKNRSKGDAPTSDAVLDQMHVLAEKEYDTVLDGTVAGLLAEDRKLAAGANKRAREILKPLWDDQSARLRLVSGKAILSGLSNWTQERYGVSFGPNGLVKQFRRNELTAEIVTVLTAINDGEPFPQMTVTQPRPITGKSRD